VIKLLSLDPSSTRTGYAIFDVASHASFVPRECGYLSPNSAKDSAVDRIRTMGTELRQIVRDECPHVAVIEVTTGKVQRRHKGGGAGLGIYGEAVGYMLGQLDMASTLHPHEAMAVIPVLENDWTCGVRKAARQMAIAARYPQFAAGFAKDTGADAADALGLGDFWIRMELRSHMEKHG